MQRGDEPALAQRTGLRLRPLAQQRIVGCERFRLAVAEAVIGVRGLRGNAPSIAFALCVRMLQNRTLSSSGAPAQSNSHLMARGWQATMASFFSRATFARARHCSIV